MLSDQGKPREGGSSPGLSVHQPVRAGPQAGSSMGGVKGQPNGQGFLQRSPPSGVSTLRDPLFSGVPTLPHLSVCLPVCLTADLERIQPSQRSRSLCGDPLQ